MSPLAKIKAGIRNYDLSLVADGYAGLTGETLQVPEAQVIGPNVPDVIDWLRTELNACLATMEERLTANAPEQSPPTPTKRKVKRAGPRPKVEKLVEAIGELHESVESLEAEEDEQEPPLPTERPQPPHRARTNLDQFKVEPKPRGADADGRRQATPVPFEVGNHVNTFVDDGSLARADAAIDRKLTQGLVPSERRPQVRYVKTTCCKCDKAFEVHPAEAPKRIGDDADGDGGSSYVCDRCKPKGPGR